jgi:hypothetical protein
MGLPVCDFPGINEREDIRMQEMLAAHITPTEDNILGDNVRHPGIFSTRRSYAIMKMAAQPHRAKSDWSLSEARKAWYLPNGIHRALSPAAEQKLPEGESPQDFCHHEAGP